MADDVLSTVMLLCDTYEDLEWCYLTRDLIEVVRSGFVFGPDPCRKIRPVRILATEEKIVLEVLFRPLKEVVSPIHENAVDDMLKSLASYGQHSFCPGITAEELQDLKKSHAKNADRSNIPFQRIAAKKCLLYFGYQKRQLKFVPIKRCSECVGYLNRVQKYDASAKTPERAKQEQGQVNSRTPFSVLTPRTRRIRTTRGRALRHQQKRKIARLEAKLKMHDIQLNSAQNNEMNQIHSIISKNFSSDLANEMDTSGSKATTEELRQAWSRDRRAKHGEDTGQFFKDQAKFNTGSKGNRWSLITYRLALAIFMRSKAAYEALKSFNILQLPSTDTLRTFMRQRLGKPGIGSDTHEYLTDQMNRYEALNAERVCKGEPKTKGIGIVIFDEVKVVDKVCWNSRNHELVGLSMTEDDYSSLHDVYNSMRQSKKNQPTTYVLQFLWRDLQQQYDIVGPWFSFARSIETRDLIPCVMDSIRTFHSFRFKCIGLVCDGASSNLSLVKRTMAQTGIFPPMDDVLRPCSRTPVLLSPSFNNPCDYRIRVHWVICPSHQLKNMINALNSSRAKGSKDFVISGIPFGWTAIQDLYTREVERAKNNLSRMVPKMQKAYIVRDAWTKLNVKPARIMIQEHVISELTEHIKPASGQPPRDAANVKAVVDYLKALQMMFDFGLLAKTKLTEGDNVVISNIRNGLAYFYDWLQGLLDANPEYKPSDAKQKKFLSWQTWDLLRVAAYGFIGLHEEFAVHCPNDFFYPVKVNGSAVETLFSQMKFSAAAKLSGANYAQARRNLLMKSDVHGPRGSRGDYRQAPLAIANEPLKQVKKNRKKTPIRS